MELEFATNRELIEELIKRNSFLGFVMFSETEVKNGNEEHQVFKVFTTLNPTTTKLLMQGVIEGESDWNFHELSESDVTDIDSDESD